MKDSATVLAGVKEERNEVMEKLISLDTFLIGTDPNDVSKSQLSLLHDQRDIMKDLYDNLTKRMKDLQLAVPTVTSDDK